MLKVTVVLATYNGERFVTSQLDSLRLQTHLPDEVIIQDDCSTDTTVALLEQYLLVHDLPTWHLFLNHHNVGFAENFKSAIGKASGDIIFLCDQDDIWHLDKVQTMLASFESEPRALCINSSFNRIDAEGNPLPKKENALATNNGLIPPKTFALLQRLNQVSFHTMLKQNISPGCTVAFTRALQCDYLACFSSEMPHDMQLNYIAVIRGGLFYLAMPLVDYRIHNANTLGLKTKLDRLGLANAKIQEASFISDCYRYLCGDTSKVMSVSSNQVYDMTQNDSCKVMVSSYEAVLFKNYYSLFLARYECLLSGDRRGLWQLAKQKEYKDCYGLRTLLGDIQYINVTKRDSNN